MRAGSANAVRLVAGLCLLRVLPLCRRRKRAPSRCKRRWRRPTATTRGSTRSAPSSARPTRTWRAPCRATAPPSPATPTSAASATTRARPRIFDGVTKPRGYGVELVQPIFRGFRTYNAVNAAEANVRAEREVLRDVERIVLLQAATAYMDVVRDQELVRLNENNVNVLSRELKASQDRFAVGEVTRTDVAQAEARRADCGVAPRCGARQPAHEPRLVPAGGGASARRPVLAGAAGELPAADAAGGDPRRQQRGPAGGGRALSRAGGQVHGRADPRRAAAHGAAGGELRRPLRRRPRR